MSLFNKLKFWRKKDDLDFDDLAEKEAKGNALDPHFSSGLGEKTLFPEEPSSGLELQQKIPTPQLHDKDLELISSKLDTIKAMLASVEQRLTVLEQTNSTEKKQRLW